MGEAPFPQLDFSLQPAVCVLSGQELSQLLLLRNVAALLPFPQDKDEQPDSLRAGLPVVSFSLGDAADFLLGKSRDAEAATSTRLESGGWGHVLGCG